MGRDISRANARLVEAQRRIALAQAWGGGEVAERLYISPHTVTGHLRHAFDKLGVNSRVALARIAADHSEQARR